MSTANIISVTPVMAGPVPVAVTITFRVHGRQGQRTYLWSAPEAIIGLLRGDDPADWPGGVEVDSSSAAAGSGIGGSVGSDISEIGSIGEL